MSAIGFTDDHEWVVSNDDGTALIGVTDYAQEQLGELVYIELPEVGTELEKGDAVAVIESVKSASDLMMPVSGEVIEVNEELKELMDEDAYQAILD